MPSHLTREIGGEVYDAVCLALPYQPFRLFYAGALVCHADIGRGIHLAGELAAEGGVGVIDDGDGDFAHHFVVVYPGVEQRICNGKEDEEEQHSLVLGYGF